MVAETFNGGLPGQYQAQMDRRSLLNGAGRLWDLWIPFGVAIKRSENLPDTFRWCLDLEALFIYRH